MCRGLGERLCRKVWGMQPCAKDVPCFLCCLPFLYGCCTLYSLHFNGESISLWTMAPLFHRPGRQLKETPIREAPISEVRLRGHAQVRLLFMSVKPTKTPQPRTRASSQSPHGQLKGSFCQNQKSATNWTDTFSLFIPLWRKAPRLVIKKKKHILASKNTSKLALTGSSAPAALHQQPHPPPAVIAPWVAPHKN